MKKQDNAGHNASKSPIKGILKVTTGQRNDLQLSQTKLSETRRRSQILLRFDEDMRRNSQNKFGSEAKARSVLAKVSNSKPELIENELEKKQTRSNTSLKKDRADAEHSSRKQSLQTEEQKKHSNKKEVVPDPPKSQRRESMDNSRLHRTSSFDSKANTSSEKKSDKNQSNQRKKPSRENRKSPSEEKSLSGKSFTFGAVQQVVFVDEQRDSQGEQPIDDAEDE